jgi:hypothetical protein
MDTSDQPVDLSRAEWRKSSRSNGSGGECVEVAGNIPGITAVRDSKNPTGPALIVSPDEWSVFLNSVKNGEAPA